MRPVRWPQVASWASHSTWACGTLAEVQGGTETPHRKDSPSSFSVVLPRSVIGDIKATLEKNQSQHF